MHGVETSTQVDVPPWGGGALWFSVRPNLRRVYAVAGDILAGMGVRIDIGGKGRNQSDDVRLAAAWLRAYGVRDLVAVDAERLDPHVLRSVVRLAEAAGLDLWLLHRPPTPDRFLPRRGPTRREASKPRSRPAARPPGSGYVPA